MKNPLSWTITLSMFAFPKRAPGDGPPVDVDHALGELLDALEPYSPAASISAEPETRAQITLSLEETVIRHPSYMAGKAEEVVMDAATKAGLALMFDGVEVMTWDEQDARLAAPAYPELVGVTELAQLLGVSRQRASELQKRHGFPEPLQVLAAGPVWPRSWVESFSATWKRKAGRPRKEAAQVYVGGDDIVESPFREIAERKAEFVAEFGDIEVPPSQEVQAMAARKDPKPAIAVEPRPGGGWAVQKDGTKRAASIHDTKKPAVDAARAQAKREGAELVIKNRDGRIGGKDSHGNDPRSSKG